MWREHTHKSNSSSVLDRALAPQLNPRPRLRLQAGERVALGPKNQTLEIVLRVLLHLPHQRPVSCHISARYVLCPRISA